MSCILLVEICQEQTKHLGNIDLHVCQTSQHVQSYDNSDTRIFQVASVSRQKNKEEVLSVSLQEFSLVDKERGTILVT